MADQKQYEMLKQGVGVWNAWREKHPNVEVNLGKANLSRANLIRVNLSGADLSRADLSGANLSGANLALTNLALTNLRRVNLSEADLSRADLRGTNLSGANLSRANLSRADLSEANLSGANLSEADLIGADLSGANLIGANLSGRDLSEADLRGTNLSEANLSRANLIRVNLSGADLSRANLSVADLSRANLREANLSRADLRGANLSEADLIWADLRGTNLGRANLSRADLSEANLRGANLSEADLSGADLSGANLSEADLSGKDLSRVDLTGSNLNAASLIDSILDHASLTGAQLWETQRTGWSIKNVICEYVYWDRNKEEKTQYQPGEFEKLYSDKTRIVLHYPNGIDPLEITTLPALLKALEAEHPGCKLRIQSIQDDAGGASVTMAVDEEGGQDMAQLQAQALQLQDAGGASVTMAVDEEGGQDMAQLQAQALQLQYVQRQLLEEKQTRLKYQHQLEFAEKLLEKGMTKYKIDGSVGQIIETSDNATANVNQTINQQVDLGAIKALIGEIASRKQELAGAISSEQLTELDTSLQTIDQQILTPEANTSVVKEALGSVGRILEGAAGNVLASEWLTRLLPILQGIA